MNVSERWLPIPGHPDYEVSDLGRIRSWRQHNGWPVPHFISTRVRDRYLKVTLFINGRVTTRSVHALVMLAFVGPRPERMEVRHQDGDPTNPALVNLAYGTSSENTRDLLRQGRHRKASQTHCKRGHPFDEANTYRDRQGRRRCRACAREARQS